MKDLLVVVELGILRSVRSELKTGNNKPVTERGGAMLRPYLHLIKLKAMKNQLTTDQAIKLALVMIIGLALMSSMTSCSTTKTAYQRDLEGRVWKTESNTSSITGWNYK